MAEELSVFRSENKYEISFTEALKIRKRLDRVMHLDSHSTGGGYAVRSLYFDSLNNYDFNTKLAGTELRKKIRLRVYSPHDKTVKLEVKQKNGDLQHKVSLIISREDAQSLIRGDVSVLVKYFETSKNAAYVYKLMMLGCYRPVALIEYDRIAYTYPHYDTRLTFDMHVRSSECCFDLFAENPIYTHIMDDRVVMEVKYNEVLMGFISKALKPFNLTRSAYSKYTVGRKVFYDFYY